MRPIGIFDSGIGGLTVARAIANRLPNVPLIYFGDTAHLPYGDKSPELIRHYASRISLHLKEVLSLFNNKMFYVILMLYLMLTSMLMFTPTWEVSY